ncbi:PAS domain-containing protein [Pelomicrobium sp. G1]|uniref:sensor histidine kinase n=1 Tax=unclassified Pelomicrobium TaxID=2815318 RepID=UPI003F76EA34
MTVLNWAGNAAMWLVVLASASLGALASILYALHLHRQTIQRRFEACARCRVRLAEEAARRELEQIKLVSQENQNRLRTIIRSAPVCIKLQSEDGTILEMNPAGMAILDARLPEQVIGKSVYEFISPQYHDAYRALTRRVFGGEEDVLEFEVTTLSNARRRLETHAAPLYGPEGGITALLGITRDVTEQRHIAQQLRENEARLRAIIEAEPECVKLEARDGVLLDINLTGVAMLDAQSREQAIGQSVYEFVAPEFREAYRAHAERVFLGERSVLEFQVITLKGRRRWFETHAVPLRDPDGRVIALLGVTRDVTERKQTEEKLRQRQMELAHVCRLTTMGEMASGLAHELNQPLCAISTYADAVRRMLEASGAAHEKAFETLQQISAQAERAGMIIRRLRDMVAKKQPKHEPVDINDLVAGVVELAQPLLREREVTVAWGLGANLPPAVADPVEIEQVVMNLIRNAVEAMGEVNGARVLTIRTRNGPDQSIEVVVHDTGPGVPEVLADQVFSPFFTTKARGLGIGLSISRSIIEAHNGRIWADNESGTGASFHFTLPAFKLQSPLEAEGGQPRIDVSRESLRSIERQPVFTP